MLFLLGSARERRTELNVRQREATARVTERLIHFEAKNWREAASVASEPGGADQFIN